MTRSVLCVGIDPEATALPAGFPATLAGVERFARLVARGVAPGRDRGQAEPRVLRGVRRRRDRGPRAAPGARPGRRPVRRRREARRHRHDGGAPGGGALRRPGRGRRHGQPVPRRGGVAPLLERGDRFAYVLCRTSNPGAAELQGLEVAADGDAGAPAEPLYARVARRATGWGPGGTVGLVVGATAPAELAAIRAHRARSRVPRPGRRGAGRRGRAGARATDPRPWPRRAARAGGGLLVNVSRGIARAALDEPESGGSERPRGAPRGGRP